MRKSILDTGFCLEMTAAQNYGVRFQHTDNTLIYSMLRLLLKKWRISADRRCGYKYRRIAGVTQITVEGKTPEDLAKCQMSVEART